MSKQNVYWENSLITRQQREQLNRHKSVMLWFTGLSGAGKSTLAHAVEERLHRLSLRTFVLDGDNIRHGLCQDLGFSDQDRKENIRRIAEISKLMLEAGVITLAAFISPFRAERQFARNLVNPEDFIEIFCRCDISVCENRDIKGLYEQARQGKIANFTGISSPYEEPINPELILNTGQWSLAECVEKIMDVLRTRGFCLPILTTPKAQQ